MKNIKYLFDLIPFLNLYPTWAQVVIFICVIIIASLLIFVPRKVPLVNKSKKPVSVEYAEPPKAILDINISSEKILNVKNNGNVQLKQIQLFATKYLLGKESFNQKKLEIESFNKIGGAVHVIPFLKAEREVSIDLTKNRFLHFFDNPGKEDDTPILTYYCFRITYESPITNDRNVLYKVTSAIKDFPSWVDNQEHTAYSGGTSYDFVFEIPEIIESHQKKIYNDR